MAETFVVGIDLGTTNTVVAFGAHSARKTAMLPPQIFLVEQRVARAEVSPLSALPSCAFALLPDEVEEAPELHESDEWTLGTFAEKRGREVPARFVSSAKSWLVHSSVDRRAAILPWGEEGVPKLSPVDVAARLLFQVRHAWDRAHPSSPLAAQNVVVTVPASFDEVARELTLEAATRAGLQVRLLEEPQAAFHAAIEAGALAAMPDGGYALVVDVGGGTTNLSLVQVDFGPAAEGKEKKKKKPRVRRVAVGRHLLLGGDNMDLALAHFLERELVKAPEKLEPRLFAELTSCAREAKEKLLSESPPQSQPISIAKRGSQLVGSTLRTELRASVVQSVVVEGFFPMVPRDAKATVARSGLMGFGLPYERDPAITRHVAAFVSRHLPVGERIEALLINGGVFHSNAISERLQQAIGAWQETPPTMLPHADPDNAVAIGAVTFGRSLLGRGQRIEGGSARAFFVGVGKDKQGRESAVCVLPKGAEEGIPARIREHSFHLALGREVRFDLYSSDTAFSGKSGDMIDVSDAVERLPPLVCKLAEGTAKEIEVDIEAELTPIGTVEISCVTKLASARERFRLAFDIRPPSKADEGPSGRPAGPVSNRGPDRAARVVNDACAEIERVFGRSREGADPREAKDLIRSLEKMLGERSTWRADESRRLADALLCAQKGRKRSLDHERVFLLLCGFCLRPGYGAPGDASRMGQFIPVLRERVAFPKEARNWQQYFISMRRVAGGLTEAMQVQLRDDFDPLIAPASLQLKKSKGARPEGLEDVWDLASHLERIPAGRRAELGMWFLERTWTTRDPRIWSAIGRIGARMPAYASAHHVVSPQTAERFIDHLLREKWADLPSAPRAASELSRLTLDRARDVSNETRAEVLKRLEREKADPTLVRSVRECVEVEESDRLAFFGESLPSGLRLISID